MSAPRPEQKYRADVLEAVSALLAGRPGVTRITMFGHPSFTVNGKMFACLYDGGLALKLPAEQAQETMTRPDVSAFRPYGKSMSTWVQIERDDAADYERDLDLIEAAMAYAASRPARPARPRTPRKRRAVRS